VTKQDLERELFKLKEKIEELQHDLSWYKEQYKQLWETIRTLQTRKK
jgi:hypothetical protein